MKRACIAVTFGILASGLVLRGQTPATVPTGQTPSTQSAAAPATQSMERLVPLLSGPDAAARAAHKKALQAWHDRTTIDAYNAVGERDPKWDDDARTALRLQGGCNNPIIGGGRYEDLLNALNDAVNNGCNDPLILYFYAGYLKFMQNEAPPAEIAGLYTKAADEMLTRPYPPVRKIYVLMHGAEIKMSHTATLADGGKLVQAAIAEAPALAADMETPEPTLIELFASMTSLDARFGGDLNKSSQRLLDILQKARPNSGAYYTLKARQLMDQARLASQDRRKQLLADAADALQKGYAADPTDAAPPTQMLALLRLLPQGQDPLDLWLERAMKADPDNYGAAEAYLEALYPRNGGSARAMVDFGRACVEGGNFEGGLPLILVAAHEELSHYSPDGYSPQENPLWFTQPPVFSDLKDVYEGYLKFDPSNTYQRSRYIRFACLAMQYKIAQENMDLLGEHFSRRVFTGGRYQQLKTLVARAATQPASTEPTAENAPAPAPATAPGLQKDAVDPR